MGLLKHHGGSSTTSAKDERDEGEGVRCEGLSVLSGTVDPLFKSRKEDFEKVLVSGVSVHSHEF